MLPTRAREASAQDYESRENCLSGNVQSRGLQRLLFDQGIYVLHSNYIGAGPGGMIRLPVFADHTPEDLDRVVAAIDAGAPRPRSTGRPRWAATG